MSSRKFIVPSTQNYQCNCFGNTLQNTQFFLSKPKNTQLKNTITPFQSPSKQSQTSSNKNSGKRSLRKNNTSQGSSPPNIVSRVNDEYYQTAQSPLQVKRERIQRKQQQAQKFGVKIKQESNLFTKTSQCNIRNNNQIINRLPAYYAIPLYPLPNSPSRVILTNYSPPPIRINFRTSSPQNIIQPPVQVVQNQSIRIKSIKSENKLKQSSNTYNKQYGQNAGQQEIIEFQLTEDNVDSPRIMPVYNKLQKQHTNKKRSQNNNKFSEYFGFKQTFKSNIDSHHIANKEAYKSIIPKKNLDKNQYQFDNSPQFKREKGSLKKINDVEETHSMPNSDDDIEDDKESVVLGRLREYGSTINPSNSFSATVGSKMVSMNTQSSIGKSYLKSFEFNSEKRL